MQAEARKLGDEGVFPNLRVGVHRGELVAGNVGGEQRQEDTVIGGTVNTASRVEGTRSVVEALPGRPFRSVGEHPVKGRSQALWLFAPYADPARNAA